MVSLKQENQPRLGMQPGPAGGREIGSEPHRTDASRHFHGASDLDWIRL